MEEQKRGRGRPPGSVNNKTKNIQEYQRLIYAGQLEFLDAELDRVREADPVAWMNILMKLGAMVLPKPLPEVDAESAADFDVQPAEGDDQ